MKIWLKFLIGIILGILAAFILPVSSPQASAVLDFITQIVIRFGRYTILPLLFFAVMSSVTKLRDSKKLLKTGVWSVLVIALSSLILTAVGILSILIIRLPRIPISVEKVTSVTKIDIKGMILQLLPFSSFDVLQEGTFLLPVFLFAGFAGAGCNVDKRSSKPVVTLIESLYKLCYNVMVFFIEMLSIGMIAVSCYWVVQYRSVFTTGIFTPLILMFTVDYIVVAFGIYPLILRYLCGEHHPYTILYASLASILVSFFTGDTDLTLPVNMRHSKESLGVNDNANNFIHPLFSIFARGGSSLIAAVSFIVIWRSYSSLNISPTDILWISGTSFGLSFVLGGYSTGGTFIALTMLCSLYGRGFESGYLLLKPAAGLICSFAAAFDALTAMFGTYLVAAKTKELTNRTIPSFI